MAPFDVWVGGLIIDHRIRERTICFWWSPESPPPNINLFMYERGRDTQTVYKKYTKIHKSQLSQTADDHRSPYTNKNLELNATAFEYSTVKSEVKKAQQSHCKEYREQKSKKERIDSKFEFWVPSIQYLVILRGSNCQYLKQIFPPAKQFSCLFDSILEPTNFSTSEPVGLRCEQKYNYKISNKKDFDCLRSSKREFLFPFSELFKLEKNRTKLGKNIFSLAEQHTTDKKKKH